MRTVEANKAIARRVIDEVWNQHDLEAIDVLCAPDYVTRDPKASSLPGPAGLKRLVSQVMSDAPNTWLSIDLMMAEGDRVALRYTAHNGHGTPAPNLPRDGQRAWATGALHVRIVQGRIRESWGTTRMAELLCRVGSHSG